jgi:hypothetical protein
MSTSKGKERAASPTGSTITITTVPTVLTKDTFPRVEAPDTFSGDRKKFKTYESQCRMYLWADRKRGDWKNLKIISEQVLFMIFRFRGKTFDRLEPYIT